MVISITGTVRMISQKELSTTVVLYFFAGLLKLGLTL